MPQFIERIRRHRNVVWVVITALLVPILQNLGSTWLERSFGSTPNRLFQLLALFVLVAVVLWFLYIVLGRSKPLELISEERRPERHAGLITLVSRPPADGKRMPPHEVAIRYHLEHEAAGGVPLRACWLVASSGEGGTVTEAMRMRDLYGEQCQIVIKELKDVFDVQDAYGTVQAIYRDVETDDSLNLRPDEIIGDFTGGTTPMSVGMALACSDWGPMQYTYGGTALAASTPILVEQRR